MAEDTVVIIGGGFTGLAAAYQLLKQGKTVTIIESDNQVGGLASSFPVGSTRLEKFYHHWFTNDQNVMELIGELGLTDNILLRPTKTGMYYANNFFQLSTPLDLLRFKPLRLFDRLRLGVLALRARRVKDWRDLEDLSAAEWLRSMGGERVYKVVWEPLLRGKFGDVAQEISAVWFWSKLKLRGGSRGKHGEEQLAYFRGGFSGLADALAEWIVAEGGKILLECCATGIDVEDGQFRAVICDNRRVDGAAAISTLPLPTTAGLIEQHVDQAYAASLRRIRYLGNICLVLELDRSLSSTYWLNVNDPDFPFVGLIEHTNFEPPETYGGRHVVYLSKYLPNSDRLFLMSDDEFLDFCIPYIRRMFPAFERQWIMGYHVWRASFSQPIVERRYARLLPAETTPVKGFYIATMAQIYPEDRGTNYAIREGRAIARRIAD